MQSRNKRYWDANVFIAWLAEESDKIDSCAGVLAAAQKGEILIATSSITLVEVIKLKNSTRLKKEDEEKIKKFFQHDFIALRNVDPPVAEFARHLIWEIPALKPKDSIHLATALKLQIPVLDTFDEGLLALNGKIEGYSLRIGKPDIPHQKSLFKEREDLK